MAAPNPAEQALAATADTLSRLTKVIITCHIKPDADALGSMLAMDRAMKQRGADSVMFLASEDPVAPEWQFLAGLREAMRARLPEDHAERTLICLDCGNAERTGSKELVDSAPQIINIDHHEDNTRFGEVNLVIGGASSTAEIIFFIFQIMEVEITPEIAEALYTGILVDSGRFQYASSTPTTLRVAADLIARGVDHTAIFRNIYERVPLAKTRLICRMYNRLTLACDGRVAIAVLDEEDFREAGAGGELTEGLVDNLRAIEGVVVGALVYARPGGDSYRVSLRSSSPLVNVQHIARLKGGGGHAQAAGLSVEGETPEQIISFLEQETGRLLERAERKKARQAD